MMPCGAMRSKAAKERFSPTVIGSISPSVLRSSGMSAMPMRARAWVGLGMRASRPATSTRAAEVAQDAEEREQELALALAVEAAEADDLAAADVEGDVAQAVGPGEAAGRRGPVSGSSARAVRGGKTWLYSRPIIISTTSWSDLVPAA